MNKKISRFLSSLLALTSVLTLAISVFPVSASANAAQNITLYEPSIVGNSLLSISTQFLWTSGYVDDSFLVLMNKPLQGSDGKDGTAGDFSELGAYGYKFTSWSSVLAESAYFGILSHTDTGALTWGNIESVTITFDQNLINTNQQHTYYIYLWVEYPDGYYIPDNLICVIQTDPSGQGVLDKLVFSPGIASDLYHRNYYNGNKFYHPSNLPQAPEYLTPAQHVCFTSNKWFAEDATNHILYECDINTCTKHNNTLDRKPHQYTDEEDFDCNDCGHKRFAYVPKEKPPKDDGKHNFNISLYTWDNREHWQVTSCDVSGCTEHGKRINVGPHTFTDDKDMDCDCGYIRTVTGTDPAAKPETGDITNIPLWAALFLFAAGLMYLQLHPFKREQY